MWRILVFLSVFRQVYPCGIEVTDHVYKVIWENPSDQCAKYGISYDLVNNLIIGNPRNQFNGEFISIFYSYGRYPLYNYTTGEPDNGGIPQVRFSVQFFLELITIIFEVYENIT